MKKSAKQKAAEKKLAGACWEGYEAVGVKKKGKKTVPNCVPVEK